jgi:hypothetical protein
MDDPDNADHSREANVHKATRLVAQTPTLSWWQGSPEAISRER